MELTNKLRSEFYPYYLLIMLSPSRTCNWLPKHSTFSIWIYTLYQQESISLRGTFFHLCRSCFASFFFFSHPHIKLFRQKFTPFPSRTCMCVDLILRICQASWPTHHFAILFLLHIFLVWLSHPRSKYLKKEKFKLLLRS